MGAESNSSVRAILERLNVGDTHIWPIEKLPSIKANASMYGGIWNRKFRVLMDKAARACVVTRIE